MRFIPVLIFLCINPLYSQVIRGTVVKVSDGDTFTLLSGNRKLKIRLYAVDCPEKGQSCGAEAQTFLKRRIECKKVRIDSIATDRYGRIVGVVYSGCSNLNNKLLKRGLAWHYKQYDKSDQYVYRDQTEAKARRRKRGLWKESEVVPPWEYRKNKH